MQYLLTEEEYKSLTPFRNVEKLEKDIQLLNDKVMILSKYKCSKEFYCDYCPIGLFGTNTCRKFKNYSK